MNIQLYVYDTKGFISMDLYAYTVVESGVYGVERGDKRGLYGRLYKQFD